LLKKKLVQLKENELPDSRHSQTTTKILYSLPVIKTYMRITEERMDNTLGVLKENIELFTSFFNIVGRMREHLDPESMDPEKILRVFKRHQY
jgi:hypothetical protein